MAFVELQPQFNLPQIMDGCARGYENGYLLQHSHIWRQFGLLRRTKDWIGKALVEILREIKYARVVFERWAKGDSLRCIRDMMPNLRFSCYLNLAYRKPLDKNEVHRWEAQSQSEINQHHWDNVRGVISQSSGILTEVRMSRAEENALIELSDLVHFNEHTERWDIIDVKEPLSILVIVNRVSPSDMFGTHFLQRDIVDLNHKEMVQRTRLVAWNQQGMIGMGPRRL